MIETGDTPIPLPDGGKVVLHLLPFSLGTDETTAKVDISAMRSDLDLWLNTFMPLGINPNNWSTNLDGFATYYLGEAYALLFRSGAIETARAGIVNVNEYQQYVYTLTLESVLVRAVKQYLQAAERLSVAPPFVLMLSLIGFRNVSLSASPGTHNYSPPFDRDTLLLPSVTIDNYSDDPATILEPILTVLWESANLTRPSR